MSKFKTVTNRPTNKVVGMSLAAAIVTLLFYFVKPLREAPDGVREAAIVIVTFLVGYLTPPSRNDGVTSNG